MSNLVPKSSYRNKTFPFFWLDPYMEIYKWKYSRHIVNFKVSAEVSVKSKEVFPKL